MKVYLIQNGEGKCKIGYTSKTVVGRIKNGVQTGSSSKVVPLYEYESSYAMRIETVMHNMFSCYNTSGEWFDLPTDVILGFRELAAKIERNLKTVESFKDFDF
jgi:hypothetical protein